MTEQLVTHTHAHCKLEFDLRQADYWQKQGQMEYVGQNNRNNELHFIKKYFFKWSCDDHFYFLRSQRVR